MFVDRDRAAGSQGNPLPLPGAGCPGAAGGRWRLAARRSRDSVVVSF